MIVIYLPVRDLIAHLNDRERFQADVTDDELYQIIEAADLLVVRAKQELNVRLAAQPGTRFLSVARP
jgi:hypothetical protein